MDPYGVLLQGLSSLLGVSFGTVNVFLGVVLALVCWRPGGVRPGLGTLVQPVVVGVSVDVFLALLSTPLPLLLRALFALGGSLSLGVGAGLYLGAALGAGPFDSVPFVLQRLRPLVPLGRLYGLVLLVTLVLGVAAGGTFGVMTLLLVAGLGPLVARVRALVLLPPPGSRADLVPAL